MYALPARVRIRSGWFTISAVLLLLLGSCDTQEEPEIIDYEAEGLDTPLLAEQLEAISEIPRTTFDLDDIILPNGRTVADFLDEYGYLDEEGSTPPPHFFSLDEFGPQTQKNLLIGRMNQLAWRLTNRSDYVYPEEPPQNGVLRPAQRGLAYRYGGKDYTVRAQPTTGGCRNHAAIYGLDCSGFIYNLAFAAGIDIRDGQRDRNANEQRRPETWVEEFELAGLTRLSVEDLGQLDPSEFKTGDIIYWFGDPAYPNVASHIGIVLETNEGELALFHSPG